MPGEGCAAIIEGGAAGMSGAAGTERERVQGLLACGRLCGRLLGRLDDDAVTGASKRATASAAGLGAVMGASAAGLGGLVHVPAAARAAHQNVGRGGPRAPILQKLTGPPQARQRVRL